jgi:hypothetical protein
MSKTTKFVKFFPLNPVSLVAVVLNLNKLLRIGCGCFHAIDK